MSGAGEFGAEILGPEEHHKGNYSVKYEMRSFQKDGTLHIVADCIFEGKRNEIAHWVACGKDRILREYLISLGWTPPAEDHDGEKRTGP